MLKYFSVYGRAKRLEYWGMKIIPIVLFVSTVLIVSSLEKSPLTFALGIFTIIPAAFIAVWSPIAVIFRRLRDAGISLWFCLLVLVPGINVIAFIVFGCIPSKK